MPGLMLYAGQGWADSFQQTLSGHASEEYVTNPLLNPADQGLSAWRSMIEPSYMLTDNLGANVLNAGLDFMLVRSSNTSISADRNNPTATLGWKHLNDKGQFDISSAYNESETIMNEPSAIGLVSANSTRTSRNFAADWSRELGERTTLKLNGAYADITFSGSSNNINLSDYTSESGGMNFNHVWSEHTATFVNFSYVNLVPTASSGPSSRQYNARLGLNWNSSARLDWTLQAGPSRLENAGSVAGGTTSLQGGLTMNYKGQLANLSLSANRQSTPSGLGAIITADQLNGSMSYDFGERSKAGIDLGWRKNDYLTGNLYRTAGVWLHRDLSPSWGMKTYFNHTSSEWGGLNPASSNLLGVSIAYINL